MAEILQCQVGNFPTNYLGINIGARLRSIIDWSYLVTKVKRKISKWENRQMSFGGRLTLVRSVLTSIPIYQLSFSIIPKAVISEIRSVLCKFLWGGGVNSRKISWVSWEEVCLQHKYGGLGVKNLECFNFALVGKWLWRFLSEGEALWVRVIRARYGEVEWGEDGFKVSGGRTSQGGWWSRVVGLSRGVGGKEFRENFTVTLGDGEKILFWHHNWLGETSLISTFPRLFRLCTNQGGSVKSMGKWEEGAWVWSLGWRRALLDREQEQVDVLMSMLDNISLSAGSEDAWRWEASPNGVYTTKSAYEVFSRVHTSSHTKIIDNSSEAIWNAPAPLKAKTTAWRALRGRMATCDNLIKRKVEITTEQAKCVMCKRYDETANHLLIHCEETLKTWQEILKWLGVQSATPDNVNDHFMIFTNLGSKHDNKFLIATWMATIWCMWKWRNDVKFNKTIWDRDKMVAEIKSRLWSWRSAFGIAVQTTDFKSWFVRVILSED